MQPIIDATIRRVAEAMRSLDKVCGVVVGGSHALGVNDEHSDVEMYVYRTADDPPSASQVARITGELGASLTRSDSVIWNMQPWGPHTFVDVAGISFEIGYRQVQETSRRLYAYTLGHDIHTRPGLHDLAFGHYPSAIASCVSHGRIVWENSETLTHLQQQASEFPDSLRIKLLEYYARDAHLLIDRKLLRAAQRYDALHFHACSARALRSLVIAILALGYRHFPGDKWQLPVLERANQSLTPPLDLLPLVTFFGTAESDSGGLNDRAKALTNLQETLLAHPAFPEEITAAISRAVNW